MNEIKVKTCKRVLIFTTKMGHQAIAEAVKEAFISIGWKTKTFFSSFPEIQIYEALNFHLLPDINKVLYHPFITGKKMRAFAPKVGKIKNLVEIKRLIKTFRPDIVISTYVLYNWTLCHLKKRYPFIFLNIVANPRTIHPLELVEEADLNLLYDKKAVKITCPWVSKEKLKAIGWLARKGFYGPLSSLPRKNSKKLRIIFCGGSWGNSSVIGFLSIFTKLPGRIELKLVAGNNKLLYNAFKIFDQIIKNKLVSTRGKLKIEVFQFVKLDELLPASDIVVGKAGPNLIFETVAAGKPFMAITHYAGQEDGNLEVIREKGIGWVAEKPSLARKKLLEIINNPSLVKKIIKNVLKERNRNILAGKKLVKLAEELTKA